MDLMAKQDKGLASLACLAVVRAIMPTAVMLLSFVINTGGGGCRILHPARGL
jgi:hypothetical protein